MPTFMQGPNPKELREFYDSQKRIMKTNLKSNKDSGVIGTPKADSEGYDKIMKLLEDLETALSVYSLSIDQAVSNEFTTDPYNPTKLNTLFITTQKTISKPSFILKSLPLGDIQKLRDYVDTLQTQKQEVDDLKETIDDRIALPPPGNLDPDLAKPTTDILQVMSVQLENIINTIQLKLIDYDSGKFQAPKLGGGLRYNLDEPLKHSAMYQTMPTRFM